MHAVSEMVRHMRLEHGKRTLNGLILANGGTLTHENTVCLSNRPRKDGRQYSSGGHLHKSLTDVAAPPVDFENEGAAVIEVSPFMARKDAAKVLTTPLDIYC